MKTEEQIKKYLEELKSDSRAYSPIAQVFSNAPLALIQTGLYTRINILEDVLEIPLSTFPLKKEDNENS